MIKTYSANQKVLLVLLQEHAIFLFALVKHNYSYVWIKTILIICRHAGFSLA